MPRFTAEKEEDELCVALDIGTTSTKLAVVAARRLVVQGGASAGGYGAYGAADARGVGDDVGSACLHTAEAPVSYVRPKHTIALAVVADAADFREQSALQHLAAVRSLLRDVPAHLQRRVTRIAVTGQMHGVVAWTPDGKPCTPLITWEDGCVAQ
jgi:sugar (pentulose or hexulose) kinase